MNLFTVLGVGLLGGVAWWLALDRSTLFRATVLAPGKVSKFLRDPLAFETGKTYRMRYTELLLQTSDLHDLGFEEVTRFPSAMTLPHDWPSELATQDDPNTRFAEATWTKPNALVTKPQGLYQVWEYTPPKG